MAAGQRRKIRGTQHVASLWMFAYIAVVASPFSAAVDSDFRNCLYQFFNPVLQSRVCFSACAVSNTCARKLAQARGFSLRRLAPTAAINRPCRLHTILRRRTPKNTPNPVCVFLIFQFRIFIFVYVCLYFRPSVPPCIRPSALSCFPLFSPLILSFIPI